VPVLLEVKDAAQLEKCLETYPIVIVCFYSSWCSFCRRFLPIFEKAAAKHDSCMFLRVKVDEDSNPLWQKYSLEVVPTVIMFKNQQATTRFDGFLGSGITESHFTRWLTRIFKGTASP
jgi:thioredoxin-like negative regulator of GroEL